MEATSSGSAKVNLCLLCCYSYPSSVGSGRVGDTCSKPDISPQAPSTCESIFNPVQSEVEVVPSVPTPASESEGVTSLPSTSEDAPQLSETCESAPSLPSSVEGVPQLPVASEGVTQLPATSEGVPQLPATSEGVPQLPATSEGVPQLPVASEGVAQVSNVPPLLIPSEVPTAVGVGESPLPVAGEGIPPVPNTTVGDNAGSPGVEVVDVVQAIDQNPNFKAFCAEIESLAKENRNLTRTKQNFSTDILLNSLDFFKALSVCPQCLQMISKVVEAKHKAREKEEVVRKLQHRILKELRELHEQMSEFHGELMSIERVVANSDVSCLESFLEGFGPQMRREPRVGDEGEEEFEGKGSIHKASVIRFRNNILAVIDDLQTFQNKILSKLECTPLTTQDIKPKKKRKKYPKKKKLNPAQKNPSDYSTANEVDPLELVEIKTELTELGVHLPDNDEQFNPEDPLSGRNSGYGLRRKTINFAELIDPVGLEANDNENEDNNQLQYYDDDPGELDNDDMDFEVDDGEGDISSGSEDSSEDSIWNDEEEDQIQEVPKKKKTKGSSRKRKSAEDSNETGVSKPKKKKKKYKRKKEVPIPPAVAIEKQSEFRRGVISRVYWRLEKFKQDKDKLTSMAKFDMNPRLAYVMDYNPTKKCLFVEDVDIRFNDDLEVLQCTRCSFECGENKKNHRSAETLMFHHVLGKHLEVYKCTECGQVLGSLKRFQDHMRGHRMQYCCDICGKPMYSSDSLYNHRWSHMNEEEMQEAVARGMRDPREKLQRMKEKGALRAFICGTCGKRFPTNFLLRQHEQIHREDRERIQCTRCGKTFLPMGFYSHQKYTCPPEGVTVLYHPCHLCPDKVFKSKHLLKRHFDRTHAPTAEERPHVCSICGRGFKTRGELGKHTNAHSETRPWVCGKGCGAAFKHKKNCSRHEGTCNGTGTPRGKTAAGHKSEPSREQASMYPMF